MVPKETLVIISRVVTLTIQILKSMRTRYTSYNCLLRKVRLVISLVTSSQQSVVLKSMKTTTFLTFSTLNVTNMCRMSPVPTIVTLDHSKMYSSLNKWLISILFLKPFSEFQMSIQITDISELDKTFIM